MARKRIRPVRIDAYYNPEGYAICPLCWSRPSVNGRIQRDAATRSKGWGISFVEKIIRYAGKTHTTAQQIKYPCSNPECLAEIVVEWAGMELGVEGHAHLQHLGDIDAEKYTGGHTDVKGVWHPTPAPVIVPVQPTKRRRRQPVAVPEPPVEEPPVEVKRRRKGKEPVPAPAPETPVVKRRRKAKEPVEVAPKVNRKTTKTAAEKTPAKVAKTPRKPRKTSASPPEAPKAPEGKKVTKRSPTRKKA